LITICSESGSAPASFLCHYRNLRRLSPKPATSCRRPKFACRTCIGTVVQAPAPARLIEGGIPTEALVAQVAVGRFADHQPLYRQAQMIARQGVILDRSTLSFWIGYAAAEVAPVVAVCAGRPTALIASRWSERRSWTGVSNHAKPFRWRHSQTGICHSLHLLLKVIILLDRPADAYQIETWLIAALVAQRKFMTLLANHLMLQGVSC
jgi:hypothetical protein